MDPREWRDVASDMFGGRISAEPLEPRIAAALRADGPPAIGALVPEQSGPRSEDVQALTAAEMLTALDRLSGSLGAAADRDEVLLALGRWAVGISGSTATLVDRVGAHGLVRVGASGDPGAAAMLVPMDVLAGAEEGVVGPLAEVVAHGVARWSPDFLHDAATRPWHAVAAVSGVRSAGTVPVRVGGDVEALLTVLWSRRYAAEHDTRSLLLLAGDLAGARLEALEARRQSDRLRHQHAETAAQIVRIHEAECSRIADLIYDDAVQLLAALDLQVGWLQQQVEESAPHLSTSVGRVHGIIQDATEGLRGLLVDLEPADVEVGFEYLVRDAAAQVFEGTAVEVSVQAPGDDSGAGAGYLGSAERSQGLRIIREILLDARERANLTRVDLAVRARHLGVEVMVRADGQTTDVPSPRTRPRLSTSQLRAALVGGTFSSSTSDGGTEVRVWLPLRVPGETQRSAARVDLGTDQDLPGTGV